MKSSTSRVFRFPRRSGVSYSNSMLHISALLSSNLSGNFTSSTKNSWTESIKFLIKALTWKVNNCRHPTRYTWSQDQIAPGAAAKTPSCSPSLPLQPSTGRATISPRRFIRPTGTKCGMKQSTGTYSEPWALLIPQQQRQPTIGIPLL